MTQTRLDKDTFDRPPSKPIPTAPAATPNTLVLNGIGLSTLCGKPGKWSMKGISGAYVMCRQETHLGGVIQGLRWTRYGRSTWPGSVVELEEDNLDRPVPATQESNYAIVPRGDLMLLLPDESYTLFYCCDRDYFMYIKERVASGELALEKAPGAIVFEFTRLEPRNLDELDLIPWLLDHKLIDEHCRDILATHLLNPARGYVEPGIRDGAVARLDVTPEPLKALFRAEFLQWYALMATQRSGEHLVALQRACSLIAASETGAPDAVMEERVAQTYAARGTPEHAMFEKYREYAWKCAASGIYKEAFLRTLPTSVRQVSARSPEELDLRWEEGAREMAKLTSGNPAGPAQHPGLESSIQNALEPIRSNRRAKALLGTTGLHLVSGYFDLYTLGRRLKSHTIEGRGALLAPLVAEFNDEWEKTRNRQLPAACQVALRGAAYPDLMVSLLEHTGQNAHRLELLDRYFDACAWAEHPWWQSLAASESGAEASLWKRLAPCVKWLSEALKAAGKTLSGLVEQRLHAYSAAFTEAHELLQALFRHEITLSGMLADPAVHYLERIEDQPGAGPNFRARVNVRNGEMIVTRENPLPDAPETHVKLRLLKRVGPEAPDFPSGPARNQHAYRLALNIRVAYSIDLVAPVDLAELKRRHTVLPKGFAACAEVLNIARAAATIADNISRDADLKEQVEPAWDVAKGVIALADSQQAMLKAMARPYSISNFVRTGAKGLKLGGAAVSALDGGVKIYKGATLLCSDEGDLEYELRQGRSLRATLQATKGIMQIASGMSGIIAALQTAAGLAAPPVGLLIAIGSGIALATLDVALDATQEFEDHVHAFEKAVDKALRVELDQHAYRASVTVHTACTVVKRAV